MKFEVYRDIAGEWRWRLIARGNRITADSGESYSSRAACKRAIYSIIKNAANATIVEAETVNA